MKKVTNDGCNTQSLKTKTNYIGRKGMLKIHDKSIVENYAFNPLDNVPVEVVFETPYFLTCKVLPHKNPSSMSCGISQIYNITVDKFNLAMKRMELIFD